MEFKVENLYGYEKKKKSGLGYETFTFIYFWGQNEDLNKIKQFAIDNFRTYKHDNTVKYGEHEIFLWSTDGHFYFVLNAELHGEERNNEILKIIENALKTTFKDLNVTVRFGKDYQLLPSKIEEFLDSYVIDINNLPIDKFSVLEPCCTSFPKLKEGYVSKLYNFEKQIKHLLFNKTITINGIKGKFKKINSEGDLGFFKLRATKNYYNINLRDIKTLELC